MAPIAVLSVIENRPLLLLKTSTILFHNKRLIVHL